MIMAGGGSVVCVMIAVVCGGLWEQEVAGKAHVVARLNGTWACVQV